MHRFAGGLCLVGLCLVPVAAHGQVEGTKTPVPHAQIVSANPFMLMFEWFNVEYERKLSPTATAGASVSFLSLDGGDADYLNGTALVRYYPQRAALSGFYLGGRLGVHHVDGVGSSGNFFGAGFEIGYGWMLGANRNFSISTGAGATRLFGGALDDVSLTIPTLRLNVGWGF
jgi:hypothetical protein